MTNDEGAAYYNETFPLPKPAIPEQAVEAALNKVLWGFGSQRWRAINRDDVPEIAKEITATLPLVGVKRPKDVARAAEAVLVAAVQRWPDFSRDVSPSQVIPAWDGNLTTVANAIADAVLALPHTGQPQEGWPREVLEWAVDKFGEIARDPRERAMRFIEESLELVQTQGVTDQDISNISFRVFSRPSGDVAKEFGQVGMTFEAMAENIGFKVAPLVEAEIARVKTIPKEEWQRRHAAKVAVGAALSASPPPPVAESGWQPIETAISALKAIIECDDDAIGAHGNPKANLNGYGLVDLFDCVGHPFGSGEHKQQPYRSNHLEAALADARAAVAKFEAAQPLPVPPAIVAEKREKA